MMISFLRKIEEAPSLSLLLPTSRRDTRLAEEAQIIFVKLKGGAENGTA
jgi:hypothetical protein